MSKRVIVNASKQRNERIINRNIDNMSGGMVSDIEPTEISPNALYHLENAVGFPDRLEGRRGSALFSDRRLPVSKTYDVTVLDGIVTSVDIFDDDVVGGIFCFWEDGNNFSSRVVEKIDDYNVRINLETTIDTTTEVGLRGNINGSYFDNTSNSVIMVLGGRVYISELVYSTSEANFSEWYNVAPINGSIGDSVCDIHMINDNVFINNESGLYRLSTEKGYFWKCNVDGPLIENKLKEVKYVTPLQYGYRYMYTYSRFTDKTSQNRFDGVVEHETCPVVINNSSQTDYSTIYNSLPNGYTYLNLSFVFDLNNGNEKEPLFWKDLNKTALKLTIGDRDDAVSENWKIEYVYFDFTGIVTFLDVFKVLKDGFKSCGCSVDFSYIDVQYGIQIVYIFYDEKIIKRVGVYDLPDVDDVYVSSSDFYSRMWCESSNIGMLNIDGDTGKEVFGLKNTTSGFTHYTVYRTYDVSGFENNDDISYRNRNINDPNVYTYVDDIPMMEVLDCVVDGDILKIDETHMWNIGSYVRVSTIYYKIIDINDDGYIVNIDTGYSDTPFVCVIGFGPSSQIGSAEVTKTVTGEFILSSINITAINGFVAGSVIFWDDGEFDIIKDVDYFSNRISLVDRTATEKGNRFFSINPGTRSFNDSTSDFVLESRNRTLPLKTRFFMPMKNNNLSVLIPGFFISSEKNKGSFEYCSTSDLSIIGYRHQIIQVNDYIDTDIQSVSWVNGVVSIKTSHATFVFDPQQAFDAGDPRFNESVFALTDPTKINDTIGVVSPKHCVSVKDGLELVYTNEPGVRFYNGSEYGDDISNNKVFLSYIVPFHDKVIIDYDNSLGVIMWGENE